jgi:hypothetical protein
MSDEKDDGGETKGRTLWDFLTNILANARLWRALIALVVVCLVLSYFDIINIRYDDGLKVRIGVDREQREKAENTQKEQSDHEAFFEQVKGQWATTRIMPQERTAKGDERAYRCRIDMKLDYVIGILDYDAKKNTGRARFSIDGTRQASFQPSDATGSAGDRRQECFQEVGTPYGIHRNWGPAGENAFWQVEYNGTFRIIDTGEGVISLVQDQCSGACDTIKASVSLTVGTLTFRSNEFVRRDDDPRRDTEITLSMHRISPSREER